MWPDIDWLAQERRNASAIAMELRLSCTNPSICVNHFGKKCVTGDVLLSFALQCGRVCEELAGVCHLKIANSKIHILTPWGTDKLVDIYKCIFFNEKKWFLIKILLEFAY